MLETSWWWNILPPSERLGGRCGGRENTGRELRGHCTGRQLGAAGRWDRGSDEGGCGLIVVRNLGVTRGRLGTTSRNLWGSRRKRGAADGRNLWATGGQLRRNQGGTRG